MRTSDNAVENSEANFSNINNDCHAFSYGKDKKYAFARPEKAFPGAPLRQARRREAREAEASRLSKRPAYHWPCSVSVRKKRKVSAVISCAVVTVAFITRALMSSKSLRR